MIYQPGKRSKQGLAAVIGFLLIFSFLMLAAAQYQTTVIPVQEENKEINHSRIVQGQMTELQSAIHGTANSNELRTQEIKLGTQYDDQIIFGLIPAIHQPDPPGNIRYEEATGSNIEVDNAEGQRGSAEYWDGSLKEYTADNTGWIIYEPGYNHLYEAPITVYENGIVYNEYESGEIIYHSDQNVISGRNINITSLGGDINVTANSQRTVETHPVSAPRNRVAIKSPGSEQLRIRLPTRLPATEWEDLLEEEIDSGYVTGVSNVAGSDAVDIFLQADTTYTLGMARVYTTTRLSDSPIPETTREYIAWDDDQVIIRENSKAKIEAQVRDKYNNAIPGVNVETVARDGSGQCIGNFESGAGPGTECPDSNVDQPGLQTSAENGEVAFIYESPEVSEDTSIDITVKFED